MKTYEKEYVACVHCKMIVAFSMTEPQTDQKRAGDVHAVEIDCYTRSLDMFL